MKLELKLDQQRTSPGRPRLTNKKVSLTIRIKPELLARITGNRSAFIEAAIIDYFHLAAIDFVDTDR